ncbi:MAG: deoxyribodipyrimidine photo-lyase, partial [Bacteroidota bacterium]
MKAFGKSPLSELVTKRTTLFWFRRDLRLQDNAALFHALKENESVLPIFIFDTEILNKLEDKADLRVAFIHQSLALMQQQ